MATPIQSPYEFAGQLPRTFTPESPAARDVDVVAIDNHSTSHGRLPYEGPRHIAVCWA